MTNKILYGLVAAFFVCLIIVCLYLTGLFRYDRITIEVVITILTLFAIIISTGLTYHLYCRKLLERKQIR